MPISQRKPLLICCIAALLCALGAAAGLYCALTQGYDPVIHHFAVHSPGGIAAACLCLAGILLGGAAAVLLRREKTATTSTPGTLTTFAAIVTAFMLLAVFMMSFRTLSEADTLAQIRILLTVPAALYFFLVTSEKTSKLPLFPFISLLPILYAVFAILCTYFDKKYGMNAPIKTYDLVMYIGMALFFTAEARCALQISRPPLYVLYGIGCVTMCFANGAPRIVVALNDTVGHGFSLVESAAWVCIGLFVLSRLLEFGKNAIPDETREEPDHE